MLKGEFQGKNTIIVDVKKDDEGKVKHLIFTGTVGEPELVAAAASGDGDTSSEAEPAGKGP